MTTLVLPRFPRMDNVPDQTFAERLKELRGAAGLTQADLAKRAGMHKIGVAKLEQGLRQPSWATVQALCKALGVSCSAFEGTGAEEDTEPTPAPEPPPPEKPTRSKKPKK
jgi:transcriptional regulator with XRE-family HTH domain